MVIGLPAEAPVVLLCVLCESSALSALNLLAFGGARQSVTAETQKSQRGTVL
jgi:hypothetical protein